ncbi:MAG: TrkA C-terminal domain-containing protein, partial [Phycisphaerales bacterium JB064]
VQSYASLGASAIDNLLQRGRSVTVAQGLEVFTVPVPKVVAGKRIIDAGLREASGCTIVGYRDGSGLRPNPPAQTVLKAGDELVLIGDIAARRKFFERFIES